MKLFKTVDERFAEIGYVKVDENEYLVEYHKFHEGFRYTQVLCIIYKESGNHIVQSYDNKLTDVKKIGNTCVGMTMKEMKLCLKKMKQKRWKEAKE